MKKSLLAYLGKFWPFAVLAALFMVGEVLADLYQPGMMADIVNNGILGLNNNGLPNPDYVISAGLRMILVVFAGGTFGVLCGAFTNYFGQNFGNEVRKACFERIMNFSFEQTDDFTGGSLITRITSDVTQVQNLMMQFTRGFVRCMMFLFGGSIALMRLDLSFAKILAVAVPLIFIEVGFVIWKTNPLFKLLQKRLDHMNTVMEEDISGIRVVRAFVQEARETERFETSSRDLADTQFKVLLLISWMRPIMNIILNLATVALIYIGAWRVADGAIQPGTLMAAITYISQILNGLMMLAMIFQTLSRGFTSAGRLSEVLECMPKITDGTKEAPKPLCTVEFDHVGFSYPGYDAPVLEDISFSVSKGETLAIIGATGSGKSSLLNLIPRFYDVSRGRVLVDGMDVRDYKLSDLRQRIAPVLQKSELFSRTIRENIALSNPDATEEEIIAAARAAMAHDFITAQPEGYDTMVSEGGSSLSGGQKQRIAIARGLLKNAEILLLDDATSALDLVTEASLQDHLAESYSSLTRIIVAQRIATVKHADRIAVLDHGRIAALGKHEELLETCAVYRDIYDSQLHAAEADL